MRHPQLNKHGELQHLLTLDGLPRDILTAILDTAAPFTEVAEREVKKLPLLRGKSVFNLFFENSTRTRTTFEIAAKRLSADVVNLNINTSSAAKGESLLDTVDNLCAMQADMFVVRHAASGAPMLIAQHLHNTGRDHIRVVNAGDGRHAHPTQGLLDDAQGQLCAQCAPAVAIGTLIRVGHIGRIGDDQVETAIHTLQYIAGLDTEVAHFGQRRVDRGQT